MSTLNEEILRLEQAKAKINEILIARGVSIPTGATLDTYHELTNSIKGGTSSSEVTATRANVLAGTRTITKDSNDEIVEGTMPNYSGETLATTANKFVSFMRISIPADGYYNSMTSDLSIPLENFGNVVKSNVLTGSTFTSSEGISIAGTMPNNGAVTPSALNCGGSYTIPAGYHNGSGKVTANSLSSQTSATATAAQIISGQTAWVNGSKLTGTLNVQSVITFKAASSAYNSVTFTWKNPAKGAFSGVIIVGKTGSYPTSISDGTRYYKGSGNNTSASGNSSVTVSNFSASTAYYFRAFAYAVKNNAEWVGGSLTATATTPAKPKGTQTFTSSGTFTVPSGVTSIDIFCVGGGGAAGGYYTKKRTPAGSGGAGGGYTATKKGYAVTPGQKFTVTIGAGGSTYKPTSYSDTTAGGTGGTTSFGSVVSASGGLGSKSNSCYGGNGGSGGGERGDIASDVPYIGGVGGSDGGYGGYNAYHIKKPDYIFTDYRGKGQGTTTRAFAESSNTLYAGGGGGGCYSPGTTAAGGSGGGGAGSSGYSGSGKAGSANTGGGGGGLMVLNSSGGDTNIGGSGGSGICIVRWGY